MSRVLVEAGAPVLLAWRRTAWLAAAVATAFFVGVYATLAVPPLFGVCWLEPILVGAAARPILTDRARD